MGWWLVLRIIVLGIGTRLFAGRESEGGREWIRMGLNGTERNRWGIKLGEFSMLVCNVL